MHLSFRHNGVVFKHRLDHASGRAQPKKTNFNEKVKTPNMNRESAPVVLDKW